MCRLCVQPWLKPSHHATGSRPLLLKQCSRSMSRLASYQQKTSFTGVLENWTKSGLSRRTMKLSFSVTTCTGASNRPGQNYSAMFCILYNFILKTSDPIPFQIFAISKFSVKYTFKKNLVLTSSESTFTWTARMNSPTGPARNLEGSQFSNAEMSFSLMLSLQAIPRIGIKSGSTAKILLLLMKILYQASVTNGSTRSTLFPTGLPLLNGPNLHLPSQRLGHYWATI